MVVMTNYVRMYVDNGPSVPTDAVLEDCIKYLKTYLNPMLR